MAAVQITVVKVKQLSLWILAICKIAFILAMAYWRRIKIFGNIPKIGA